MSVMVVALANEEADLVRFFDDLLFPLPSAPLRRRPEDDVDVGEKLVTRNKAESSAPAVVKGVRSTKAASLQLFEHHQV